MIPRTAIAPTELDFDASYRAAESRDPRFDGRMFGAVTTTGVYCRPVCPSRMPRRANVRFFASTSAAEREGFRPCRRCLPAAHAESRPALVDRALESIAAGYGFEGLASGLGTEAGRLRRAFVAELGVSPSELIRAVRACGPLSLPLAFRPPLDAASLLAFLGGRTVAGVEEVRGPTYRRSLTASGGPAIVALTPHHGHVRLDVALADIGSLRSIVGTARSMFDLDVDPAAVSRTLGRDPALRPLVRAHPGIRVPAAADGLELAVRAVVGQQVSVAGARTMLGRIAARFGTPIAGADPPVATGFPYAEALADAPLEELGVIGRRACAIRRIASLVAGGGLNLRGTGDPGETVDTLREIDGVGPWTAEYVRMRALRDPDAFVASDLGVRHAFMRLGLDARPGAISERAEEWRPWRAYATMLLWRLEASRG